MTRRAVSGLDPFPTRAELEAKFRERTGRELVLDQGPARHAETRLVAPVLVGRRAECEAIGERLANGIRLVLPAAPRTKKNHGRAFGIKQSAAYVRFRDLVKDLVAPLATHLGLPLHDEPYNIAAVYYVDKPGERADLTGLHQGLFDALQDAGVVTDDYFFRTSDGSRIVFGDERPRVEVTITLLSEGR